MPLIQVFISYFHYLIHPFRTHDILLHPERYPEEDLIRLSPYESLTTSWVFVMVNGIIRVITLNFVLIFLYDFVNSSELSVFEILELEEFPGLYFLVLSSIVDVIFYPLFGVFIIQFWELIIRFFGKLNGTQGDLTQKAHDILAVKLSSKIISVVPFIGSSLESFASMLLMYAGLRKQLNTSVPLTLCILFTPVLLLLMSITMIFLLVLVIT